MLSERSSVDIHALHRQGITISEIARRTANDAFPAEGRRLLIEDPTRLDAVKVVGVDEHVWRHTRRSDKYVTVIIDLTPVRDGTGPSRLLDVVEGRSKKAFKDWLAERDQAWRDGIEVVAMDGFAGFKTATTGFVEELVEVAHDDVDGGFDMGDVAESGL